GAPRGQEVLLATVGCGQCHGPTLNGPRADLGAVNAEFDWLKSMVYDQTTSMPKHWALLDEMPAVRVRMGNYSRSRLLESVLEEIWTFARDLGFRAKVAGQLSAGVPASNGVTYTLTVENEGLTGKGLTAEDLTIQLILPAGSKVVSTNGAGYQGVHRDEQAKAEVAVWQVSRLAPQKHQNHSHPLSQTGTASANVTGDIP